MQDPEQGSEPPQAVKGYTKYAGPFKLVYTEQFPTRIEAYRREMFLKTGKGREFIKSVLDKRA